MAATVCAPETHESRCADTDEEERKHRGEPLMSAVVHARGLSKRYGATVALDNVNLDIEAGRIVGLVGPNGAGKTTALKAILGLAEFDGDLSVLGLDPRAQRTE